MTREEAKSCICTIKMLQRLAYNIHGVMDVIDADNCKKIIKALEQEPCEDCISRTQAIKAMDELENEDIEAYGCSIPEGFDGERARRAICLLPSIQLKPKTEVLDKIRAEIKALSPEPTAYDVVDGNPIKDAVWETLADALQIIDKYKAESEEEK